MKKMLMTASVPSMIGQFNMNNIHILLEMGYEVHVACNFRDFSYWPRERIREFLIQLKKLGVHYHQIGFSRSPKNIRMIRQSFRQMDKLLNCQMFEFVHCHTPMAGVVSRVCCHKNKVKVLYTAHGFHFYDGAPIWNWAVYYPIEKILSRWTDLLIAINREDYRRAKRKFHAGMTVYVPGIGLDTKKFERVTVDRNRKRAELGIEPDEIVLLSVGELNKNKNHRVVIEALGGMDARVSRRFHYCIAGEGKLRDELICLACQKSVNLHLLGFRNDVDELLKTADIFILPSIREGLNVSLMEAMASGLPAIVSDIRGNRDLIDHNCGGKLFYSMDKKGLGDILSANEISYGEMGKYNQWKIRRFSQPFVSKVMEKIYRKFSK